MIERRLAERMRQDASYLPVLTLLGPRQSGKSTLVRSLFTEHAYVNLERPDLRAGAAEDPRGLLARHGEGVILDEIQRVPELLSWIQASVDEDPRPGRFVLTGSNQHALSAAVSQTLAGRTSVSVLLPPDHGELMLFPEAPGDLWTTLWAGAFPRIHDVGMPADRWLAGYVQTYVERDVRQVVNVGDLVTFSTFLRLAASRTAQETNLAALGSDTGVTQPTARAWLSVLESSYLAYRLPPWLRSTRKRLVKSPKLHLVDSGLICWLLGIRGPEELVAHPLRGAVFESWVALELYKQRLHRGQVPRLHHLRESRGLEIDLVVDDGARVWLVEVKSGATVASDWFGPLRQAKQETRAQHPERDVRAAIVYGGDEVQARHGVEVIPWRRVASLAPD